MYDVEYPKLLNVLFQYGLWPIEWSGDYVILRNPHNDTFISLSSDPTTLVPRDALPDILSYAGMDESQFWQLYDTL